MQVVVDSLLTQYKRNGNGKLVVLLHGWADSANGLQNLQLALGKTYEVIALDLPGFGGTEAPATAWDLDDYVLFIQKFLAKINASVVYAFVGHSNGGAMAIRGLGQEKLTAEKLVLLASAGIRNTAKGRNAVFRVVAKTGKVLLAPLPGSVRRTARAKLYKSIGSDMLVAEQLQETFKKIVADDVQADASKVDIPVLLIYGEQDKDVPVWFGEKFHELFSDSTLEILPGAGHFVHLDRPKEVQQAIEGFLR